MRKGCGRALWFHIWFPRDVVDARMRQVQRAHARSVLGLSRAFRHCPMAGRMSDGLMRAAAWCGLLQRMMGEIGALGSGGG